MAGDKYLSQASGVITEVASIQTSAGVGSAGKIPALDTAGRLAVNMMPVGITPEVQSLVTSENLTSGNLVNIDTVTGFARKADNSNGRIAHGFVLAGTTAPAAADVYVEGIITGLTALTAGTLMFLGVAGAVTATSPSTTGYISQQVGTVLSTTTMSFQPQPTITLA